MSDAETPSGKPPTWIRQAVDFGALAAFAAVFLFFRLRGVPGSEALVHATWGLVAGSAVAIGVGLAVERRLALMPLLVGGFALVFGVLTLVFNDDLFVKLKVTALNASLAQPETRRALTIWPPRCLQRRTELCPEIRSIINALINDFHTSRHADQYRAPFKTLA